MRASAGDDNGEAPSLAGRVRMTLPAIAMACLFVSALGCPRQGATYRVVFEGRVDDETLFTHEVEAPIPASAVQRCEATE